MSYSFGSKSSGNSVMLNLSVQYFAPVKSAFSLSTTVLNFVAVKYVPFNEASRKVEFEKEAARRLAKYKFAPLKSDSKNVALLSSALFRSAFIKWEFLRIDILQVFIKKVKNKKTG